MNYVPRNMWDVLPFSENPAGQPSVCQTCGQAGHTEDSHAAIPDPNATTTIQTLPPELMLNVLSHLPARQIQGCRAVSKDFCELIDDPKNDAALLRAVGERYDGLADAQYFAGTHHEPNFPKFLFAWIARRGVWKCHYHTEWIIESAVAQYAANNSSTIWSLVRGPESEKANDREWDDLPLDLIRWLGSIGDALVQAYVDTHCPDLTTTPDGETPKICEVNTVEEFLAIVDSTEYCDNWRLEVKRWGLTTLDREDFRQWYLDIKSLKEPKGPAHPSARHKIDSNWLLSIPRSGDAALEIPKHTVTDLAHWKQDPEPMDVNASGFWSRRNGRYTAQELGDLLGVALPELGRDSTYGVRSTWAVMALCRAKKGQPLTAWEKAAVLEELYLF
ncbi:hypothetical protein CKM354_001004100 [Cercospora kikuchii]|uniref:F-box domain-containing protein n=1 Tax=Cercospora kikuchii TaxID=84275 RepID=A0A9P3FGR9_9PEZI|nr:uncharacterized protein CKM354_001004100 [Cercospora kikuchii]GIZ46938.1 hypothetical protein CKM354_001004100 [Cercospora kikuchii]